jgi:vacuolar-type H+-ATPase subunit H
MSNSTAGPGQVGPETEALLQRVSGMISGARALPLSSSVKLDNKDEILELLREASERLPQELRQARWMIKERDEYLEATQRKSDELVESARSEAQRLVQRTEILKEAQAQARRVIEQARDEARRLRLEAEDYADQKLAQFEIVLERTLKTVASGRQKLSGIPEKDDEAGHSDSGSTDVIGGRARTPVGGDRTRPSISARPGNGTLGVGGAGSAGASGAWSASRSPGGAEAGEGADSTGAEPGSWTDEHIFDQDRPL